MVRPKNLLILLTQNSVHVNVVNRGIIITKGGFAIIIWKDDYVGIAEIAEVAKVSTGAVVNWRKRFSDFPTPVSQLKSGPVFNATQVNNWLRKRGKIVSANIICMINLKGGVGKTTTTVGLSQFLAAEYGKKVLVVDLDPQTNATVMLIGDELWKEHNDRKLTLATLFNDAISETNEFDLEGTLIKDVSGISKVKNIDLLPSSIDLIDMQDRLVTMPVGRYYEGSPIEIINRAIKPILNEYDYVIIDCPPNLGLITLNGLRISHGFIIPTIPDVLSTYGIPQVLNRVQGFASRIGEDISPFGIVITKFRQQTNLHKRTLQFLQDDETMPTIFDTIFPENVQMAEAGEYNPELHTLRQKWGYTGQFDRFREFTEEVINLFE